MIIAHQDIDIELLEKILQVWNSIIDWYDIPVVLSPLYCYKDIIPDIHSDNIFNRGNLKFITTFNDIKSMANYENSSTKEIGICYKILMKYIVDAKISSDNMIWLNNQYRIFKTFLNKIHKKLVTSKIKMD